MLRKFIHDVRVITQRPVLSWLLSAGTFVVMVGAFTDFLIGHFGTWQTSIIALAATVIIAGLAPPLEALIQLVRSLGQTEVMVQEVERPVPQHRGLIVLSSIGQGIGSAESAIRYHWRDLNTDGSATVLEHCWIITGGPASEQSATGLVDRLVQDGVPLDVFHPRPLPAEDADNPEAVHRLVDCIYAEAATAYGLSEEDIIADYTGGTKSMTAGLVLACTSPRRPLQFMKPKQYDPDGQAQPAAGSTPAAIDIHLEMVSPRPSN